MPSPFPGMDPYLESPDICGDVHHELISEIRSSLNPLVRPTYVVRVELRVYVSGEDDPGRKVIVPDARIEKTSGVSSTTTYGDDASNLVIAEPRVQPILIDEEIEEARLEISHVKSKELVTVIEILSPTNKTRGSEGRKSFMKKRRDILASYVNWVEIDLLRSGQPSQPMRFESDYRVFVCKGADLVDGKIWPIGVRQSLPIVSIPLRKPDKDVPLDLGAVLRTAYDRAGYDLTLDYSNPPDPPLEKSDAKWAEKLLRSQGLR